MAWSLAHNAEKLRAEDVLRTIGPEEASDDAFFELAEAAFDRETAERAMYFRLKDRQERRIEQGDK